jgi:TonB family protein
LYSFEDKLVMGTPTLGDHFMTIKAAAAALLLSPLMVHAQANTPAQPRAAQAPVLQSSLIEPVGPTLSSASAADRPAASATTRRVSTGVVAPKLVHTVAVQEATTPLNELTAINRKAVVSMIVDETGKPSDVKIVESAGVGMDEAVIESVNQYRFQPGTVSGQPVAFPLNLHITIDEPGE